MRRFSVWSVMCVAFLGLVALASPGWCWTPDTHEWITRQAAGLFSTQPLCFVLIDRSHHEGVNQFVVTAELLSELGFPFEITTEFPSDLSRYSTIVLETPTVPYTTAEIDRIESFVLSGGGLVVLVDYDFGNGRIVNATRDLLSRFNTGAVEEDSGGGIYTRDNGRMIEIDPVLDWPDFVSQVSAGRVAPVLAASVGSPYPILTFNGVVHGVEGLYNIPFSSIVGEVVVLGDNDFFDPAGENGLDNAKFLRDTLLYTGKCYPGSVDVAALLKTPISQGSKRTFLDALVEGVKAPDNPVSLASPYPYGLPQVFSHAHQPFEHRGWFNAHPGGDFTEIFTARARSLWASGLAADREQAMFSLGYALHFLQDASVPHHAEASCESTSVPELAKFLFVGGVRQCLRQSNGAHRAFENYVSRVKEILDYSDDFDRERFYPSPIVRYSTTLDFCWDGRYNSHCSDGPFAWVDDAAHISILAYPFVNQAPNMPGYDTWYPVMAHQEVYESVSHTAGFILNFFNSFDSVVNASALFQAQKSSAAGNSDFTQSTR